MTYPLYDNGDQIGFISLWSDDLRLHLRCECEMLSGVHRAWAVSGTDRLLIGVLAPENGKLVCEKAYSLGSLGSFDFSRVTHGDLGDGQRCQSWQRCHDPCRLFADETAKASVDTGFEYWTMPSGDGCLLAAHWQGEKFPMPGLFCLCSIQQVCGKQAVVIRLDRFGTPVIAP